MVDEPRDRCRIYGTTEVPVWCVSKSGANSAIASLRAWKPEVIYIQCTLEPQFERQLTEGIPSIFFAHCYSGACISGNKSFRLPLASVCNRKLSYTCLFYYYPRRCGGFNPLTMLNEYRKQIEMRARLVRYAAVVTASEHMKREYVCQGLSPHRVHVLRLPVAGIDSATPDDTELAEACRRRLRRRPRGGAQVSELRLLFVGRMEWLKGGHVLIMALPEIAARLRTRIQMNFVGDGRERATWIRRAQKVEATNPSVSFTFDGWLDGAGLAERYKQADLLVVPSLWPEPFGMVGSEAARYGLPAVGFDVGGISEWLQDNVNGQLASGKPASAEGLTRAVIRAISDPEHYRHLCEKALKYGASNNMACHLSALSRLCDDIIGRATPRPQCDGARPSETPGDSIETRRPVTM
jgi:glycosyltransferase involved in cell wall biosynthesis